jgi:uncharacterized protein (TIGR02300 family)
MVASERPAGVAAPREPMERRLAKTDLGAKQSCPSCGAKFYDLNRRPAVCPKCTTSFDPSDEGVKVRRGRSRVSANETSYDDDDELEDKKKLKSGDEEDEDESEEEETAEVDVEAEAEPLVTDDDEDAETTTKGGDEELPEGFSEDEADLGDDAGDDDSVPLLEDEEELSEDELGEIAGGDEEDESR